MIQSIYCDWLSASSTDDSVQFSDQTIEVPRGPVTAITAMSAVSQGASEHSAGSAAAYIRAYGEYTSSNRLVSRSLKGNPANNSRYIHDCFYVMFRLTTRRAQAWSQATVFRYGTPFRLFWYLIKGYTVDATIQHNFNIVDSETGKVIGSHRIITLAAKSKLDLEEVVPRSGIKAAQYLDFPQDRLQTLPVDQPDDDIPFQNPEQVPVF